MESRRKKRKGTPAPPLPLASAPSMRMGPADGGAPTPTRRRKPTGAAARTSLAPAPPVRMAPADGGAPTARRRSKPTGDAAPPPPRASVRPVRMAPGDGGAPTARRRSKPTGDAARTSLAPAPSVRMARGDGGAPTARSTRKPTGASAPPSLAPPPSVRMGHSGGGAPPARRRRMPIGDAAPPSLAPAPSVRMGPGNGGAPTERRRRRRTGTAVPPCPAPPASVRMAHGDEGTPPQRKRKGSSSTREGKRGRRTNSDRSNYIWNSSAGWHGGPQKSDDDDSSESSAEEDDSSDDLPGHGDAPNGSGAGDAGQEKSDDDDSTASLAVDDDTCEEPAGHGDDPNGSGAVGARHERSEDDDSTASLAVDDDLAGHGDDPNGSRAVGAGHTQGSPDAQPALSAPSKNVARGGKIVVAHTPNTPPRFQGLLRTITSIIPCEHKGKSYECSLGRMNAFLRWSKAENAFFFEWNDDKMEMTCWIHNIKKGQNFKFTVNAAFSHNMDNINVERAAIAFSTNFIGGDEYWSDLKDTLLNTFGSFEDKGLKDYDYLYVFTRVGDSICFRNFKITSSPKAADDSSGLVLTEMNTTFFLKLVHDQVTPHLTQNQIPTELSLYPNILYSIPSGQMGSSLSHWVDFNGETYSILLENEPHVSSLQKLDGFNTSLAEIVVKESLLKVKHIIGSKTDKTHCFARQRCKTIFRSLFAEIALMFESGKCISMPSDIQMHHVLVRATEVKLYGVPVTDYVEELAKHNVRKLVGMVKSCFPQGAIPTDLYDLLADLQKDPLNEIRTAKDDCSLLKAEDRRSLLININSDYMTNVQAKCDDEPDEKIDMFSFFDGCPNADDWDVIMLDNEYMVQVCNVGSDDEDEETVENVNAPVVERLKKKEQIGNNTVSIRKMKEEMNKKMKGKEKEKVENINRSVAERMKKKKKFDKNTASIRKMRKKKKEEPNKGKLQFSGNRNFEMHMPEKARKDGLFPFRLGMADYILTAYFPGFLRFVQKRMREVKSEREKLKKMGKS